MIISIHQPAYLPWLGYFDKISRSDVFVYLDTVQLEKNSYSYRNKIKTPQGSTWLTIPLKMKGHTSGTIENILIDNSQQWKKKHLKNIFFNYKKSPFFDDLYPKIELLYKENFDFFSDLAYQHLLFWLDELNIKTKIIKSSNLDIDSKKSELVLDLCQNFKTDKYISGILGKDYLDEITFKEKNIEIEYRNYQHPVYQQLNGDFLTHMGVIDFWMNSHDASLIT
jgi:hypothetical protein